jgi:hypothetical protein
MSTYSFIDVTASLAGPTGSVQFGYGNGIADEGITIEPAGDKSTMQVGADGSVMHSLHADKSGHVTIRVMKVADLNAQLQTMYDLQTSSSALHGSNTIVAEHKVSGDITTCSKCAFKKKPTIKYGKDGDVMEWSFDAGTVDTILGTY